MKSMEDLIVQFKASGSSMKTCAYVRAFGPKQTAQGHSRFAQGGDREKGSVIAMHREREKCKLMEILDNPEYDKGI